MGAGAPRSIGILTVHGIGEQRALETVTAVATNFYRALQAAGATRLSRTLHLEDAVQPATFAYTHLGAPVTVRFYEAYWADLDRPYDLLRWIRLVIWGATVWLRSYQEPPPTGMRLIQVGPFREALTRGGLFVLSLLFLVILATLRVVNQVVVAVFRTQTRLGRTLYDFLGDVQLFVSEDVRYDTLETLDRKTRYAIRTRLWHALARAHLDPNEDLYIIAHSLGTVALFNALMEQDDRIPTYLDSAVLGQRLQAQGLARPTGSVNREAILAKIRAIVTLGSPLDKFAAIWPRVIPVNAADPRPNGPPIRWINVHDILDVVGADLGHFGGVPGLTSPENVAWRDQPIFATAHTSYWTYVPGDRRFIDCLVDFIHDRAPIGTRAFARPRQRSIAIWLPLFAGGLAMWLYLLVAFVWLAATSAGGRGVDVSGALTWVRVLF